ncbi:hypothetical protein SAMN06297229_0965 [Pseudidiomarina planktonica]|uniref:DUF192 domain-containing protein n=1 Tax=Pseudidiomarina planktonica TaxID=1323738 RepID=A0A1Y6EN84_9GAMM|nr:DUF192 domain-containing protein [Pseudidiomarina planktonica]RUO65610.1 DUF192 domain-containing protein [Pseudidiomarina planktonica]SMQ64125.1 hypothetical protein SAMN06297229_0965 [Pseudidiomarina planktonica]
MKQGALCRANGRVIWPDTKILTNYPSRLLGLLCYRGIPAHSAYWFPKCHSIHTYGMRFSLDVIALNREQQICQVTRNVQPNQVVRIAQADSLIEVSAGCFQPLERWLGETLIFIHKDECYENRDSTDLSSDFSSSNRVYEQTTE